MAQNDMNIANQGFPGFRADLNDALAALVSNSSGATAPATTFAHQFWVDTSANPSILKVRNADNDAFITIGEIDQTGDKFNLKCANATILENLTVNAQGDVRFADSDSSHFIAFQAPATVTSNVTFTLPAADGTNGQVIQTNGSGTLSFATPAGGTSDKIEEGNSKVEVTDAGTGKVEITVDAVEVADFTTGAIVFNETGADQDFRVESDTNPNMFIVDAGQDRVFIANTGPNVNGNPTNQCFAFNEGAAFAFSFTGQNAYINISTAGTAINLRHQGANSGSIVINTSTVAYNTSSDYRLKENIAPMAGALAKVAQLNPVTYTWKADGSAGEGFIAHELQAVCPDAVSGDKDAVNDDGSIKPQGVDTSFLVATLTAAIQELKAELDQAKTRIAALEAQ